MQTARDLIRAYLRSDAFPLTLLALLVIVIFYDVVFFGRTLVTSSFLWGTLGARPPYEYPGGTPDYNVYILDPLATAVSSEPIVEKLSDMLRGFEAPIWNTDTAMGRPLLGGFNAELTNPFRLPLALFPSPWMWDATLLARFWVAGVFTYLLMKRLGGGRAAALGAGAAYMLSGYFMLYVQTPHVDYAMALPIVVYAFELLRERGSPLRVAFAAGAVWLLVLTDNPEAAAIGLLFAGLYYLFRVAPALHADWRANLLPRLGPFALAAGAGIGMTAVVLIPFLELTGSLPGFDGYGVHRHTAGAGIGLMHDGLDRVVSLFVPYFNGVPVSNFEHTGLSGARNWFGILPAGLAVFALARRGAWSEPRWFFGAAGAFFIMKTYGVPVVNEAGRIPLLEVIDWSLYAGPCISLSVAMLAGFGVQRLREGRFAPLHLAGAAALLALLGAWFLYLNRDALDSIPKSHLLFWVGAPAVLGAIILAAAIAARRGVLTLQTAGAAATLLIAVELALPTAPLHADFGGAVEETFGRHITIVERPQRHDPTNKPPYIEFLEEDDSVHRVFGLDRILYPNYQEAYGLDAITGFTATAVERYYRYVQTFIQPEARSRFTGSFLPPLNSERSPPLIAGNPMFDVTNVKYVVTRADRTVADSLEQPERENDISQQFRLVYENEVRVWENLNAAPRAFIAGEAVLVEDEDAALEAMQQPGFDPLTTAVVEDAPESLVEEVSAEAAVDTEVVFDHYGENDARIEVTTQAPGLLVFTDTYYPGWSAKVNGEDAEVYPVDLAFRGVFLPEGEHIVEFSYSPASYQAGLAISVLSIVALGVYASAVRMWPRIRRLMRAIDVDGGQRVA